MNIQAMGNTIILQKLIYFLILLSFDNLTKTCMGDENNSIEITYVYLNQAPYENITNPEWKFRCCNQTEKSINGIVSRSIHYISNKHCPHFQFTSQQAYSIRELKKYLLASSTEELQKVGLKGKHFIFGPLSMSAYMYYKMQYNPRLFTWQPNFAKSQGMVTVQRKANVDLTQRILRAIKKSSIIMLFLSLALPTVSVIMWVLDRNWHKPSSQSPVPAIFSKMYLSIVTLTTVGYGDIVPLTGIGKVRMMMLYFFLNSTYV